MDYVILHDELFVDPLARGYVTMSDDEAAIDLNTKYRLYERETLSSAEIYELTDSAEFQALTDAQKIYVRDIWGLGNNINVKAGSKARYVYIQIFTPESITITTILGYVNTLISRAQELGLGEVNPGDITKARAYPA